MDPLRTVYHMQLNDRSLLKRYALLLAFFLLAAGSPAAAQEPGSSFTGEVVDVKDGDTIEVLSQESLRSGRAVTVRLHGIDAPEIGQPFGMVAKVAASGYAFGKAVRVEVTDVDRYGRAVGRVEIAGGVLNEMMVRAGLAWWWDSRVRDVVRVTKS